MQKNLLLLLVCLLAAGTTVCAKKLPKKEMALQLYSIRDLIGDPQKFANNHAAVFKQLKDMGYTAVEAAYYGDGKFYGLAPEEYKAQCEAAGLKPISSHTTRWLSDEEVKNHDFTEALKWWKQAIAAHKAAGCKYIVTPAFTYISSATKQAFCMDITPIPTSSRKWKARCGSSTCSTTLNRKTCSGKWMFTGQ